MLITPVIDAINASKQSKFANQVIKPAKLSQDVISWLSGKKLQQVHMVGLAVDFYLSIFLRDVLSKKFIGEPGFDPISGDDVHISHDLNFNIWAANLSETIRNTTDWQDSFMLTYLCAAVAGELRHAPGSYNDNTELVELSKYKILNDYQHKSSASRSDIQKRFLSVFDDTMAEEFLTCAVKIFTNGHWSSGYGGLKWAEIARTGLSRVRLLLSPVEFIDRVYDLKHNGGPMFDKNKAVRNYQLQEFLTFKLDVKHPIDWKSSWTCYSSEEVRRSLLRADTLKFWPGPVPYGPAFKFIEVIDGESSSSDEESSDDDDDDDSDNSNNSNEEAPEPGPPKTKITVDYPPIESPVYCVNGHVLTSDCSILPDKA